MKKFLSIFAFVAMLCIPFCLISCGDDDDPVTSAPQGASFTISRSTNCSSQTVDKVIELIQSKMGKEATVGGYSIVTSNKAKGESLIKGIANYKAELDKIVAADGTVAPHLTLTFKSGATVVYEYKYEKGVEDDDKGELISYGTYTYKDKDGLVWEFTYTDKDAGNGNKVGSIVVPKDFDGVKAGTYNGTCKVYSMSVVFSSDETQKKEGIDVQLVGASFGLLYANGTPTSLKVFGTQVITKEFFQKTK